MEIPDERVDGKSVLAVMNSKGDTKTIWDPNNADEVAAAKKTFDELKKKSFLAFKVTGKEGEKGEQIHEFDPKAGRIIMCPPLSGGA